MMKPAIAVLAALTCVAALLPANADEVRHYEARSSETFSEAVTNFNEYNLLMQDVLGAEALDVEAMERVHELTYTLEVALAKMIETLDALPETLEEVHQASEGDDAAALRARAGAYLDTALALQ